MKKLLITLTILTLISFTAEAAKIKVCIGARAWGVCIGVEVVIETNVKATQGASTNYTGGVSSDGKTIIINNLPPEVTQINLLQDFKYTKKNDVGKFVTISIKKGAYKISNAKAVLPVTVRTDIQTMRR